MTPLGQTTALTDEATTAAHDPKISASSGVSDSCGLPNDYCTVFAFDIACCQQCRGYCRRVSHVDVQLNTAARE
ncbi:MAG: hypothetical protein EBU85_01760 [Actinobacteria bacterium]|nr:hypothetical protein [Actinomycetota bacterium]